GAGAWDRVSNIMLGGDLSGPPNSATVNKVNAVSYPAARSTNTVPVVNSGNTITYEDLPVSAGGTVNSAGLHPSVNIQTGNALASFNNSVAENTLYSFTLAGGTLGTHGHLICSFYVEYINNSGANVNYTLNWYLGTLEASSAVYSV